MSGLVKLLLALLVTGLSLNPAYAAALMRLNDMASPSTTQLAAPHSVAGEYPPCHSQSLQHHEEEPSCCKTGQCDCAHACAVLPSIVPTSISHIVLTVATRFILGLPPLAPVRFFRPPIV